MRRVSEPDWQSTTATVYTVGAVNPNADGDGYLVIYSYKVDERFYSGEFASGHEYHAGDTFSLRYDPSNPERNERNIPESRWITFLRRALILSWFAFMIYWFTRH